MAWYKIDDQLHAHPKARRAGLEAMGLWTLAGSHSMSYLTDGFVEEWFVSSWPHGVELADALVREGLWLVAAGGWQFHDWGVYQPTRESVLADREAAAERMRRVRGNKQGSSGEHDANVRNNFGRSSPSPAPAPSPELSKDSSSPKMRETSLPKDWAPTAEHLRRAKELNVDVVDQAENFRLHAETHGRTAKSWNAAFTTWLKKARPKPVGNNSWMDRSVQ